MFSISRSRPHTRCIRLALLTLAPHLVENDLVYVVGADCTESQVISPRLADRIDPDRLIFVEGESPPLHVPVHFIKWEALNTVSEALPSTGQVILCDVDLVFLGPPQPRVSTGLSARIEAGPQPFTVDGSRIHLLNSGYVVFGSRVDVARLLHPFFPAAWYSIVEEWTSNNYEKYPLANRHVLEESVFSLFAQRGFETVGHLTPSCCSFYCDVRGARREHLEGNVDVVHSWMQWWNVMYHDWFAESPDVVTIVEDGLW